MVISQHVCERKSAYWKDKVWRMVHNVTKISFGANEGEIQKMGWKRHRCAFLRKRLWKKIVIACICWCRIKFKWSKKCRISLSCCSISSLILTYIFKKFFHVLNLFFCWKLIEKIDTSKNTQKQLIGFQQNLLRGWDIGQKGGMHATEFHSSYTFKFLVVTFGQRQVACCPLFPVLY